METSSLSQLIPGYRTAFVPANQQARMADSLPGGQTNGLAGKNREVVKSEHEHAHSTDKAKTSTGADQKQNLSAVSTADNLSLSKTFRQQISLSYERQSLQNIANDVSDDDTGTSIEEHEDDGAELTGRADNNISTGSRFRLAHRIHSASDVSVKSTEDGPPVTDTDADQVNETAVNKSNTSTFNVVSSDRSLTSSLQLTTAEGDVVTVGLSRSQSSAAASLDTDNDSLVYARSSLSSQLNISITGDINEDESEALANVIKRVNDLAEKLYQGDVNAALGKLHDLNVDPEQLTGIALNMTSSMSYTAVSAYSRVGTLVDTGPAAAAASADVIDTASAPASTDAAPEAESASADQSSQAPAAIASQAVQETRVAVADTLSQTEIKDPVSEIRKLFVAIADSLATLNKDITSQQNDYIKQIFDNVVDDVEQENSSKEDDADDDSMETGIVSV